MKKLLFVLLFIVFFCPAFAWPVVITGKVQNYKEKTLTLDRRPIRFTPGRPSTEVEINLASDGSFSYSLEVSEPTYYTLEISTQKLTLIVFKSDIDIQFDASTNDFKIAGGPELDLFAAYSQITVDFNNSPEIVKLNAEFTTANEKEDKAKMAELQSEYKDRLNTDLQKAQAEFLEKNPLSVVAVFVLTEKQLDESVYWQTYINVANTVKKAWPDYSITKELVAVVEHVNLRNKYGALTAADLRDFRRAMAKKDYVEAKKYINQMQNSRIMKEYEFLVNEYAEFNEKGEYYYPGYYYEFIVANPTHPNINEMKETLDRWIRLKEEKKSR